MNKFYIPFLFSAIACLSDLEACAGQKLRVFFLGNSYTYTNNMPLMIANIAASMGDTLLYEDHTPGGYSFEAHWTGLDPCLSKIKTNSWDYFVLQEQSQRPAFGQYLAMPSHPTYTYAGQFIKLIRDSAKCTSAMFYMTWGYKNGDSVNCPLVNSMCTYQSMDSVLRVRYLELADSFDAVVSPVGAVRRYIRQHHPGIELYQPDESHPSVAGTYAAACCFYAAFFRKDPSLITFNSTLSVTDASNIRAAAKKVVYDSMSKWGLGIYDLFADYQFAKSGNSVTFTNKSSLKATNYSWNFGDGNTSTLKDPVHTYAVQGNYTVTLTAYFGNGCSKVAFKKVNLIPSSIRNIEDVTFAVVPNPATESIAIHPNKQVHEFKVHIANALGQTVYQATAKGTEILNIDLSAFNKGMYYITVYNDGSVLHYHKFIKQ